MQTSQGYIFFILQHFVTKFCNFTNFDKFFTGIYFFLSKSKISLILRIQVDRLMRIVVALVLTVVRWRF
jgi:hypothetical protein